MQFHKATKSAAKLRLAISGPSGSGKTYSSLAIAQGLGGRVVLIDSENHTAEKYGHRFDFDTASLSAKSVDEYIEGIQAAAKAGYEVLIIDSLSHAWEALLDEVNRIAKARYRGNTFSAWSEGTPKQRKLIEAITQYPGHVIATMRAKTEWVIEEGQGGKSKPTRVGTAPEQRKGIEFEFDMTMEITHDHMAMISKDRTEKFQDQCIEKPGREFGVALAAWLADGTPPPKPEVKESEAFALACNAIATAPSIERLAELKDTLAKFPAAEKAELRTRYTRRAAELKALPAAAAEVAPAPAAKSNDEEMPWTRYENGATAPEPTGP